MLIATPQINNTQMGTAALENRLLQYNAKGHFMNALLCFMAMGDEVRILRF